MAEGSRLLVNLIVVLGLGLGLVLPAWMFWYRRRCLSDPAYRRAPEGELPLDGGRISPSELDALIRWERWMKLIMLLCFATLALIVLADLALGLGDTVGGLLFLGLFLMAGAGVWIQLSARCPRCRYWLGLQSRLGLPEACERCGVGFRDG